MEDEAAWSHDEGDDEDDAIEEAVGEDDALHDGGDSDDAGAEGEVHVLCDGGDRGAALSVAQADSVCEHSSRISALQQAAELLEGQQLSAVAQVLRNAMREEQRASVGTAATDAGVAQSMRQQQMQEEQALAKQRQRVRTTMEAAREAKKAKTEAKEMQVRLAAARQKLRETSAMQETLVAVKTFTPAMLGLGSKAAVENPTGSAAGTSSIVWPPAALSSQRKGKTIGLGSFALGTRRCAWSMTKLGAEYLLSRCSTSVRPWLRARPAPWPISWPAKPNGNSRTSWRCACDCAGVIMDRRSPPRSRRIACVP